jgi:hypothetical protein
MSRTLGENPLDEQSLTHAVLDALVVFSTPPVDLHGQYYLRVDRLAFEKDPMKY